MKKVLVALGLFAVTALAPGVVSSAQSGAATPGITWGVPRIVDPIHAYGEPDIKVAPNGDVLVSGPQGTGVQRSIWNVSKDNGDSWRVVNAVPTANSQPACTLAPALCLDLNKSSLGLGGGDTELAVSRNNTIYYDDLWALSCFTSATSSDSGATVQSSPVACSHPPADRQWLALFDPGNTPTTSPYKGTKPLVYLAYNNIVNGGNLDMSTDGLTFTPAVSGTGTYGDTSDDIYADGNLLVDQPTGDVLAVVKHNAPSPNNGLALAVGVPNADGSGQVTFHYNTITDAIGGDPALLFPVMAEDTARNLYAVWAVDTGGDLSKPQAYHVYYSFASAADGWKTWSAPRQLDSPPSMSNVFPWVAAGGPGIMDAVWYGTDQRIDPSAHKNQAWNVYLSQVNHADSASPDIVQSQVTPHPMHYDDICLLGTGCVTQTGNRNLADFFQDTIDNDGRVRVVYPDTSNGLLQPTFAPLPGFNGTVDHSGAALVTVATQQTGLNNLTGQPLTAREDQQPIGGVTDPAGDALFKPLGGANVPGADITNLQLAMDGSTLHAKVTVAGDGLGSAATTGGGLAAEAVVRWQLGNVLYYAAVEEPAGGGQPTYFAGPVQTVDLCSVSACDPHYFTYPAPPAGGTAVTGAKSGGASGPTTYDIAVPLSVVGQATADSLLEEVTGLVTVSPTPASVPLTAVQAAADVVPIQIEGTRTFNFRAASLASAAPAPAPAPVAAPNGSLPRTGPDSSAGLMAGAGVVMVGLALGSRRLFARTRATMRN